jgi:long-chain acyl-CoA synthetase
MIKDILPLDKILRKRAARTPRKTFIKFEGKKFTFADIDRFADVFASFLRGRSMERGSRVAILCHNCPLYIAAYFGIIRAGGIVLPLNTLLTHEEIDYILNDAGVTICFYDSDCAGTVIKIKEKGARSFFTLSETADQGGGRDAGTASSAHTAADVSTILYTSGTTARPKGALLTHRNFFSNAQAALQAFDIRERDRFIVFLPLFHSFTFTVCVIIPVISGCTISLLPSVRPFSRVVKRLILDRVTFFVAIPTIYKILAEKGMPFFVKLLLGLRVCISGAAPLPVKVIHDFEREFKVPLLEGYGLTEASPVVSVNPIGKGKRKPGTVGPPLPGLEVKIVDDEGKPVPHDVPGELIVKGPSVMREYLNRPEDTAKTIRDGWLYTGDIASLDTDGYIKIIDRKKDMIIVDGLNVYPYEVEEVLHKHPAVKDCAMIGVFHDAGKELPIMYVVSNDGQKPTPKVLRDFLSEHVAHYKIPRRFIFIKDLPRTATGKILKKEIRKMYMETEQRHS